MLFRALLALGVAASSIAAFLAPPAAGFPNPELARLIFFHLPCAFVATIFVVLSGYYSIRVLIAARDVRSFWDIKAVAAQEIALLTSLLTMATGILFSKVQWGAWWNWDPRQTSFLLVLLILFAYFAIRAGLANDNRRSVHSAAYGVASLLPILFLIFVYPRLPNRFSLHPSNTMVAGGFDPTYRTILVATFVVLLALCIGLFRLRTRVGTAYLKKLDRYELEPDYLGSAPTSGVVRPARLPREN